ncbi:GNAT family N-acetyltransferase [Paenibacillus tepidiphilus]|uniref:GNAT family N-acetyltransferase n=1 Tax=Paenibacillus tepidiphilus TaxID=2608683 RepID=UPI00193D34AA|nr:GNAT family N-acetyltransferase [Paenibacillus tepidiphilus]
MNIHLVSKEAAWKLRHEVMWPEREPEYVRIDGDDAAEHYGLLDGERLVSVVSLFREGEEAQFRKFATLEAEQGKGYGTRLLEYVLAAAAAGGAERIYCNARSNKAGFYAKFGLAPTGESFHKGGKEYVIMERRIGAARPQPSEGDAIHDEEALL